MNRRIRSILIAVAALVVVAVVGALVFIIPNMGGDSVVETAEPAPPTSTPAPAGSGSGANTGARGFGVPDADLSGRTIMVPNNPAGQPLPQRDPTGPRTECTGDGRPVTSPESVMIQRNFGYSTLYSETDGPSYLDGLVLAGYSRTPQGAALAAANLNPRLRAGGMATLETIQKLTLLATVDIGEQDLAAATTEPINTAVVAVRAPVGFRILSCSDSFAVVELAMIRDVDDTGTRLQNPTYTGLRFSMVWDAETWKVRESQRGTFGPYSSLDGFTRWAL